MMKGDRSRDVCRSIHEVKGDMDYESDVEVDENNQLDLDSEHKETDLLSQSLI